MLPSTALELWDYRRRVADLYHEVRSAGPGEETWLAWRTARDALFRSHPQSALEAEARTDFAGLSYFAYDPAWRFQVELVPFDVAERTAIGHSGLRNTSCVRFARAKIEFAEVTASLAFYWLEEYGGGGFVPFGDLANGSETYAGGRHLLDSAKGADLGKVTLDLNYAYHPSCVYSDRWSCPLPLAENRLPAAVRAGERI
jgi:uncharacterized protein (DUF1684 family)